MNSCRFCGSRLVTLPHPHPAQAMLSDGRIWPEPLAKVWCTGCGAVAHVDPPDAAHVRRFDDGAYDLGADPCAADASRNQAYTDLIRAWSGPLPARVLEIGCGSGQTLAGLAEAWPETRCLGLEAAAQLAARPGADQITIVHGFVEDLAPPKQPYDLIYAINVIEHAADPAAFLQAAQRQLAPGGRILLVCPAAEPPNLELVFLDHIHTFTPTALSHAAAAAGLVISTCDTAPPGLAGFQIAVLVHRDAGETRAKSVDIAETAPANPTVYLSAWQGLDALLQTRLAGTGTVDVFGAGEMAALIRCYAPQTWERVRTLLVDSLAGARALDRPVRLLTEVAKPDAILIATHPRAQPTLAARLRAAGHRPVVFNDVIAC
ncbi:MAG: class I SAM-dependent methyltransferase [Pseudomonadota bacterium]